LSGLPPDLSLRGLSAGDAAAVAELIGACDMGHLGALFVHPDRWRHGIATFLLERAELAMVERGLPTGRLWTAERAPARHFYQRHGWVATGESRFREDFGMTVVGYEKRLVESDP
jgi:GNAT superfamily N-acetyltransferase